MGNFHKAISASFLVYFVFGCTPSTSATTNEPVQKLNETTDRGYTIASQVLSGDSVPFIKHEENKPFGSYLAMNLPYPPVKSLFDDIQKTTGQILITRGEAHITVITPVEYDKVLKKHVSISDISKLAEAEKIQSAPYEVVCLGKGELVVGNELLATYFIVTASERLLEIRRAIHKAFVQGGGAPEDFSPEVFYQHITVGFTKRDLHLEDGIVKNDSSCAAELKID
jgi:hypothetical protein